MKVLKYCDTRETVCVEKSALIVLDGLGGLVPKQYKIAGNDDCDRISILQEHAGMFEFIPKNVAGFPLSLILKSAAGMIRILEKLNISAITQNDFHFANVMFSDIARPVETMRLIDFGYARPITNRDGRLVIWDSDMNRRK